MYRPAHFEVRDFDDLRPVIEANPLATVIVARDGQASVNALPIFLKRRPDGRVVLIGHMSRHNSLWHDIEAGRELTILFHGPHAYINSAWYASPDVPTWNYILVSAVGVPRLVEQFAELQSLLQETVSLQNQAYDDQWTFFLPDDLESEERLTSAIVGFELEPRELVGKFKMNQNRARVDIEGVVAGLARRTDDGSRRVREWMSKLLKA